MGSPTHVTRREAIPLARLHDPKVDQVAELLRSEVGTFSCLGSGKVDHGSYFTGLRVLTYCYQPVEVGLSFRSEASAMIDPYDPPHPDGPDDADDLDDLPGAPSSVSWLDDDDPADEEWGSHFLPLNPEPVETAFD